MKFTLARETEYTPKWNGNDKAEEPIVFGLRYLNTPERDSVLSPAFGPDGKPIVKPDYQRAFNLGVVSIRGLTVDAKPITARKEFLELPGFYELFLEVASQILLMNAVDDSLKNSP